MRWRRTLAVVLVVPAALSTVAAEGVVRGDDASTAEAFIDRVEVTAGAGEIRVEGETSFAGAFTYADETGDASPAGVGFDLESATIEQLDEDTLEFRLTVADLTVDAMPVARMEFPVVSIDGAEIELWAWRTYANALTSDPSADWTFTIATITSDGFLEAAADGELDGSTFVWRVSPAQVGGRAGAYLSSTDEFGDALAVQPITSSCGVAGLLSCGAAYDRIDQSVPFVIGGSARVELRTSTGAYIEDVVGKVRRGTFAAVFTDLAPGDYLIRVVAEYADAFTAQDFPVTVG